MNARVIRRFVIIAGVGLFAFMLVFSFRDYFSGEPGDYEVRRGDIRLTEGSYDEAMASFNEALELMPDHRGALMGRALVFIATERYADAEAELDYLIDFLEQTLDPDDRTGIGTLAAAYANRGVIKDRQGRHEEALEDYLEALRIDEGPTEGPGIFDQIIYGYRPSTVRDRAIYLIEQFKLPEEERVLLLPPKDDEQRMYKP